MRAIVIFMLVFVSLGNITAQEKVIDARQFEKNRQEILMLIDNLRREYLSLLRNRKSNEANKLLDEIEFLLKTMDRVIPYVPPMPQPMSFEEFTEFKKAFDAGFMIGEKIKILEMAAGNHYFSFAQLLEILDRFTFDDDKIKILEVMYPRVLDTSRSYVLFQKLTFDSSKRRLESIIKNNERKSYEEPHDYHERRDNDGHR